MLLLFETAGGHALFEVRQANKLAKKPTEALWASFSGESVANSLKLKAFASFKDTSEAVAAATELVESKMGKGLKKFLTKHVVKGAPGEELGVADAKLGSIIKEKLGIAVVQNPLVHEALRGARVLCDEVGQSNGDDDAALVLSGNTTSAETRAMRLGLSHSLSRYKLKFSPDKVDTMVVQAVGLLDDLDKEVNTYAMRVREWYGWHFPELAGLVNDNLKYARVVLEVGSRDNFKSTSDAILAKAVADAETHEPDEILAVKVKETAEMSMGTEVDEADVKHMRSLAEQVVELSAYRSRLAEYLRARMQAVAPNLTVLVGELVGARLVQHAGSILNLAKHPASTVQILGAEKALFRALKTKHDTPKYGLIYHASLVGQASPKNKGKISRVLAAKCALAVRVDALAEDDGDAASGEASLGYEMRAKVELRLRQLEGGAVTSSSSAEKKATPPPAKKKKLVEVLAADAAAAPPAYSSASDLVGLASDDKKKKPSKRAAAAEEGADDSTEKKKKKKKEKDEGDAEETTEKKPKKKKKKQSDENGDEGEDGAEEKPKKKKKREAVAEDDADDGDGEPKKKKKKKKQAEA